MPIAPVIARSCEVEVAKLPPLDFVWASNLDADAGLAPVSPLGVVAV